MRIEYLHPESILLDGWNSRRVEVEPDPELVASVRELGVLEPVGVRWEEGPTCVYGFRRVRAARAAGLEAIPCVYVEGDETIQRLANIAENYHRRNLRPWELAESLHELSQATGEAPEELGRKAGVSPEYAAQLVRVRRRLAPMVWAQFCAWGVTMKVPFSDLVNLSGLPWDTQIEEWNRAHDWYGGARRGSEYRPGPAKVRKMLARVEEHPDVFREGPGFAAGVRYALRVVAGKEAWRHGGVASLRARRARAKARAGKGKNNGNEEE